MSDGGKQDKKPFAINPPSLKKALAPPRPISTELQVKIRQLEEENAALRRGIAMIHRRCQKNEGAAARMEKLRAGYEKDLEERSAIARQWQESVRNLVVELERLTMERASLLSVVKGWFS